MNFTEENIKSSLFFKTLVINVLEYLVSYENTKLNNKKLKEGLAKTKGTLFTEIENHNKLKKINESNKLELLNNKRKINEYIEIINQKKIEIDNLQDQIIVLQNKIKTIDKIMLTYRSAIITQNNILP